MKLKDLLAPLDELFRREQIKYAEIGGYAVAVWGDVLPGIRGAPRTVHIEGAELRVCVPCSKYGTEVRKPRVSTGTPEIRRRQARHRHPNPRCRGGDGTSSTG
jgi:hypothetical protein